MVSGQEIVGTQKPSWWGCYCKKERTLFRRVCSCLCRCACTSAALPTLSLEETQPEGDLFRVPLARGPLSGAFLRGQRTEHSSRWPWPSSRPTQVLGTIREASAGAGPGGVPTNTSVIHPYPSDLRRVGNILHTSTFGDSFLRELVLCLSCLREALNRLQEHFLFGGNMLGSLNYVGSRGRL